MSSIETEAGRTLNDNAPRQAEQRNTVEDDPTRIEQNIDATRADMRETLAAIERKLSVDRLIDLTVGRFRERGGEFASNLTDVATKNPMPVVLTAVGIAWMMLVARSSDGSSSSPRPTSSMRDRAASMRNRAAGVKASVMGASDRVSEQVHGTFESSRAAFDSAAESVRDTASHAAEVARSKVESVRGGAEYAQQRMQRMLDEQPLMLGALGLAAGALIGALLPHTESEDRLVGDVRKSVVQKVAQTTTSKVRDAARAAKARVASYAAPASTDTTETDRSRPH